MYYVLDPICPNLWSQIWSHSNLKKIHEKEEISKGNLSLWESSEPLKKPLVSMKIAYEARFLRYFNFSKILLGRKKNRIENCLYMRTSLTSWPKPLHRFWVDVAAQKLTIACFWEEPGLLDEWRHLWSKHFHLKLPDLDVSICSMNLLWVEPHLSKSVIDQSKLHKLISTEVISKSSKNLIILILLRIFNNQKIFI